MGTERIAVKDYVDKKLDEIAEMSEYWARRRAEDITPSGIRAGILFLIEEVKKAIDSGVS